MGIVGFLLGRSRVHGTLLIEGMLFDSSKGKVKEKNYKGKYKLNRDQKIVIGRDYETQKQGLDVVSMSPGRIGLSTSLLPAGKMISRKHATLEWDKERSLWKLTDSSKVGTTVIRQTGGKESVKGKTIHLLPEDKFKIFTFTFQIIY